MALAALGICAVALAQQSGGDVVVDAPTQRDLYLAGRSVTVRAPVAGDVVAAAATIDIDGEVSGDAILAGQDVSIEAVVSDDVRAAGRTVTVGAPVVGHAVLAGESVVVEQGAHIGDFAWLAGQRVVVRGNVRSLRASGREVVLAGEVIGDAEVEAASLRLEPGAVVRGDLRWAGDREPVLAEGASVEGDVVQVGAAREPAGAGVLGALFWIVSLAIAAVLLLLVVPSFSASAARCARASPWKVLGAGIGVLALAPIVIALSFLTGVLWLVGSVLLAAYVLALLAGALLGVLAAGDLALDLARRGEVRPTRKQRVAMTVIAALVVGALALVPVLGPIVLIVLTVVGIGSALLSMWNMRARRAPAPLAAEPSPA